jgi:hypothetical protein
MDASDQSGQTALHKAVACGRPAVVQVYFVLQKKKNSKNDELPFYDNSNFYWFIYLFHVSVSLSLLNFFILFFNFLCLLLFYFILFYFILFYFIFGHGVVLAGCWRCGRS